MNKLIYQWTWDSYCIHMHQHASLQHHSWTQWQHYVLPTKNMHQLSQSKRQPTAYIHTKTIILHVAVFNVAQLVLLRFSGVQYWTQPILTATFTRTVIFRKLNGDSDQTYNGYKHNVGQWIVVWERSNISPRIECYQNKAEKYNIRKYKFGTKTQ